MPRTARFTRVAIALAAMIGAASLAGSFTGPQAGSPADATTQPAQRRLYVVPITFTGESWDASALDNWTLLDSPTSLKAFFDHVSNGRANITGTVAPMYHVRMGNPCDVHSWWIDPNLHPSGYTDYVYVTPNMSQQCGWGWAGIGGGSEGRLAMNGAEHFLWAIRHEFGHNLGFVHTTNEDPYNAMSIGCDFQAAEKWHAGWLDDPITVTASGTYTITGTHAANAKVLRIPTTENTDVWVEVRDWTRPPYVWEGYACVEPQGVVMRSVPRPGHAPWATTLLTDGGLGYFRTGRAVQLTGVSAQVCVKTLSPGTAAVEVSLTGTGICGLPPAPLPAPVLSATTPGSPAASTAPRVVGSAPEGSTVSLYKSAACTGAPVTASAAQLAAPGILTTVALPSSTTFTARATHNGRTSACSNAITYQAVAAQFDARVAADGWIDLTGSAAPDDFTVSGNATSVVITGAGAVPALGAGCVPEGANGVRCTIAPGKGVRARLGAGNDRFTATTTQFAQHVNGDDGNDTLSAVGNAYLWGDDGNDVVVGGTGLVGIGGGNGDDVLVASALSVGIISGGPGDDLIDVSASLGADQIFGNEGNDTVSYAGRTSPLKLSLDGRRNDGASNEGDLIRLDVENVVGGNGNDVITVKSGDSKPNVLRGMGGKDTLKSNGGNDRLEGGDGNDKLDGGKGADVIDGGPGTDTVVKPKPEDTIANVP